MKKLHNEWARLGDGEYELDIAAGKVRVYDRDTKRWSSFRLQLVYTQLIQRAYEDGRKDRIPFVRA